MIIKRQKEFARRDYIGLSKEGAKEMARLRREMAKHALEARKNAKDLAKTGSDYLSRYGIDPKETYKKIIPPAYNATLSGINEGKKSAQKVIRDWEKLRSKGVSATIV